VVRKIVVTALALSALAVTTACTSSSTDSGTPSAAQSSPKPADAALPTPSVNSDVESEYGKDDALEAYKVAAEVVRDNQFSSATLTKTTDQLTEDDFAGYAAVMTRTARDAVDKYLAAPDKEDSENGLGILISHGATKGSITFYRQGTKKVEETTLRDDLGAPVDLRTVAEPTLRVGQRRLEATFVSSARLHTVAADGKKWAPTYGVKTTLYMTKSKGNWLVDGWQGEYLPGAVGQPDNS
jgi:hypothetical protein